MLRYLAEAYRSLDRTVPIEKRDERLRDIISWLGFVVRSVDSSLVDEWENAGNPAALDAAPPQGIDEVVADRRGCTLLVRNALFRRVTLAAREHVRDLGELDEDWGMSEVRWQKALDAYHEQHEEILTDGDARSAAMFTIDESRREDRARVARAPDLCRRGWRPRLWHHGRCRPGRHARRWRGHLQKLPRRLYRGPARGLAEHTGAKRSGAAGNIASGPAFALYAIPYSASSTSYESASAGSSFAPVAALARLVKRRLHGLVAPGELTNGKLVGLVVGQTQIVLGTATARSSLVFSQLA